MARTELEPLVGKRQKYRGWCDKHGIWNDYQKYRDIGTTCIQRVEIDNKIACMHVWVFNNGPFLSAGIQAGDYIEFSAEVQRYKKVLRTPNAQGLMQEYDYRLAYPAEVRILQSADPMADDEELAVEAAPAAPAPVPVATAPPAEPVDVFAVIVQAKKLHDEIAAGDMAVTLAKLPELNKLAEKVGGLEKLAELMKVLKA